jgi:stress response protein SCP2
MPLYDLEQIKRVVAEGKVHLANERVERSLLALGWKVAKLHALLQCIDVEKHFHRSHTGMRAYDGRMELDVDAYKICFDEDQECEGARSRDCIFYMKLALREQRNGDVVAVVSFHLDGQP